MAHGFWRVGSGGGGDGGFFDFKSGINPTKAKQSLSLFLFNQNKHELYSVCLFVEKSIV